MSEFSDWFCLNSCEVLLSELSGRELVSELSDRLFLDSGWDLVSVFPDSLLASEFSGWLCLNSCEGLVSEFSGCDLMSKL